MTKKVAIIGAGAVGMTVATYLKRHTDYDVLVFSSDTHTAYSQCGIPFVLEGIISDFPDLVISPPDTFIEMGIDLHLNTKVRQIDAGSKKVMSDSGVFEYDHLLIATGSTPFIPPIPGIDLGGVFTLHTLSDGMDIEAAINNNSKVVVIGANGIGIEVAASLARRGTDITLIENLPQVLPLTLDPDMASFIGQHLISMGIRVMTGTSVDSVNGQQRVESVSAGGETLPADIIIVTSGLKPLTSVAREAGYDIGPTGGIVTDERLRVSMNGEFQDNVYSGGECTQVFDLITGSPVISRLGSAARRMARVIGENLAGKETIYPPTLSPGVVVAGHLVAGSVGITSHTAKVHGINIISGSSKGYTRAGYYPGAKPLFIKLLFSKKRLVGAQVVSGEGVKERIDALSLAIGMGAKVDDLLGWETSYSPPVAMVIDPVTFAVEDAKNKMEGIA
ncbi:MAG TPA: FAD-dependent oxidoreductase [Methanosarcinales archaeon]|nr:FAD-dependent oxidoreductase [Methanosarcinales archaeon]